MARSSLPSGIIPDVWNASDGSDPYEHNDLVANWDAIDAALTLLRTERSELGDIKPWFRIPGQAIPADAQWAICDGRSIAAGNHDFPIGGGVVTVAGMTFGVDGGGVLHLPDLRAKMLIGADPNIALGTVADPGDTPGPGGVQGVNDVIELPNHYHDHPHIHRAMGVSGVETDVPLVGHGGLSGVNSNGGFLVANDNHVHQVFPVYTSGPRSPDNPSMLVSDAPNNNSEAVQLGASLQKISTGGSTAKPTGGTAGDTLQVDARPLSAGIVWRMFVKRAA